VSVPDAPAPVGDLPDPLEVQPVEGPLAATVRPPGSKSITNRALVCAALADGESVLAGVLTADDTEAMLDCLRGLGVPIRVDAAAAQVTVRGVAGRPPVSGALLDARLSGTTSRFVAPVAALSGGTVVLDGAPPLRARPMGDLLDALEALGAEVDPLGEPGHLPVQIDGRQVRGGTVSVAGDVSSQFLSGLLLSGPCLPRGLEVEVTTPLVSRPYVDMTLRVMEDFGARVEEGGSRLAVAATGYRAVERYAVEPDASAASYFLAAAAICGGRVRVEGLGTRSVQGDVAFVDVLERMGAEVERGPDHLEVRGTGRLRGVEVDLADCSDTAQTLAAVAPFADGPTVVRGIGFIRRKETDRIAAVVTELRRLGVDATEDPDGFTVHPGPLHGGVVRTYDDHRMAMSMALVGLRVPGVLIADPGCVAKTYPGYWRDLEALRPRAG
jgi:3-phosphoshikimate 1-carboxyvinyltransferase